MLNERIIPTKTYDPDEIAEYLQSNPDQIRRFEESYKKHAIDWKKDENNLFEYNSREASRKNKEALEICEQDDTLNDLKKRIVENLVKNTTYCLHVNSGSIKKGTSLLPAQSTSIIKEELMRLPANVRPMCTDELAIKDISSCAGLDLLQMWIMHEREMDPEKKMTLYHHFRQGMDILDLDEILYSMLDQNPNAMSHWLPQITVANAEKRFFKIPETIIVKVPLPILQLTRISYETINQTTKDIVNEWAKAVFRLDKNRHYFIKTGTYSSKFDFRNAKVTGEKEVMEIGEYLLFCQFQAQQMASPLAHPIIYGASTTTEWVVREFIEDTENNPCIYKGLPLHTEYRVFVDFDDKRILGISPYWDPETMKKRFQKGATDSPHDYHDYVIYKAHEPVLMGRYHKNQGKVLEGVKELLGASLTGQWSIDIMQNGEDFWLIDMATADTSALNSCINSHVKRFDVEWASGVKSVFLGEDCSNIRPD